MKKYDFLISVLLALAAGYIFYPLAAVGVCQHHDGIMLKPALDVLSGQMLFRDTFSQYGPLTTYLHALALWFEPSLLSMRIITVGAYAGSILFLYLAWRTFLPVSLSLVAGVFFIIYAPFYHPLAIMKPWSSVLALFFQSLAVFALTRIIAGRPVVVWSWILGVACACTLWCRQPVGVIMALVIVVIAIALQLTGWRHPVSPSRHIWSRAGLGFGMVSAFILGYLAMNGAADEWWAQNIVWPRIWAAVDDEVMIARFAGTFLDPVRALGLLGVLITVFMPALVRIIVCRLPRWVDLIWAGMVIVCYLSFARGLVRPWLLLPEGGWNLLIIAVISIQAILVLVPFRRTLAKSKSIEFYLVAAVTGVALGSLMQFYPVPEGDHAFWAITPGLGVFIYACWRWTRSSELTFLILISLMLIPIGYDKYRWREYTLNQPGVVLESPAFMRGMRLDPARARSFQQIDRVIKSILAENPDRPAMLYGHDALYLAWFNNRKNPSPYYVTWPLLISGRDRNSRTLFLLSERPVLVMHSFETPDCFDNFMKSINYKIVASFVDPATVFLYVALPVDLDISPTQEE